MAPRAHGPLRLTVYTARQSVRLSLASLLFPFPSITICLCPRPRPPLGSQLPLPPVITKLCHVHLPNVAGVCLFRPTPVAPSSLPATSILPGGRSHKGWSGSSEKQLFCQTAFLARHCPADRALIAYCAWWAALSSGPADLSAVIMSSPSTHCCSQGPISWDRSWVVRRPPPPTAPPIYSLSLIPSLYPLLS